jgi:hypothetical protein
MTNPVQTCSTGATPADFQWVGMGREGARSWMRYGCRCGASFHDVDSPPDARPLASQKPDVSIMPHVVGLGATALTAATLP